MDNSPFAKLPAELRNHIYSLALIDKDPIQIDLWEGRTKFWQPPAILQTCRQLRNEASGVYYGSNTFRLCCNLRPDLKGSYRPFPDAWTTTLEHSTRKFIRHIQLFDHENLALDEKEIIEAYASKLAKEFYESDVEGLSAILKRCRSDFPNAKIWKEIATDTCDLCKWVLA